MKSSISTFIVLLILLCHGMHVESRYKPYTRWTEYTLSFGKNIGNKPIKQAFIDAFIKKEIMPKIDGFKIVQTQGVWKGTTENSFDVVVLSKYDSKLVKKMESIAKAYKKQFKQDSVLFFFHRLPSVNFL